jgi:hypothetical protein
MKSRLIGPSGGVDSSSEEAELSPYNGIMKMDLTFQFHHGVKWHDPAAVTIPLPDAGVKAATTTAFEDAHFLDHGAKEP